jgi:TPR repeat protein
MVAWAHANDPGDGVPENVTEAVRWLKRAMGAGHPFATFRDAAMLESGRGREVNPQFAALVYRTAATAWSVQAQVRDGKICEFGECGVAQSNEAAEKYYEMAVRQNSAEVTFLSAEIRVRKNMTAECARLYQFAADNGYQTAQTVVGENGKLGESVDNDKARRYLTMAADREICEESSSLLG